MKKVVILYDKRIDKRIGFLLSTIDTRKTATSVKGYILLELVTSGFTLPDAIKTVGQFEFYINELQAEDVDLNNFDIYKGTKSCLFYIDYYKKFYKPFDVHNPRNYYYSIYLQDFVLKTTFNQYSGIFQKKS